MTPAEHEVSKLIDQLGDAMTKAALAKEAASLADLERVHFLNDKIQALVQAGMKPTPAEQRARHDPAYRGHQKNAVRLALQVDLADREVRLIARRLAQAERHAQLEIATTTHPQLGVVK